MKSVDEIKQIAATYTSGPIMGVALNDAIKWIEAYREVATHNRDRDLEDVDAEAARILEKK